MLEIRGVPRRSRPAVRTRGPGFGEAYIRLSPEKVDRFGIDGTQRTRLPRCVVMTDSWNVSVG
jgi:hypothetical protein